MASKIPKQAKLEILNWWIAEAGGLYACLLTSAFPNTDGAYTVYGDLTNELVTGAGYTRPGKAITGEVAAYVGAEPLNAWLDADDTPWAAATFPDVKFVVVYRFTSKKIVGIYDLGAVYSVINGTFTVQWNASGLVKIS